LPICDNQNHTHRTYARIVFDLIFCSRF
jgi:hypothetical protein